jgi:hypothetical protein
MHFIYLLILVFDEISNLDVRPSLGWGMTTWVFEFLFERIQAVENLLIQVENLTEFKVESVHDVLALIIQVLILIFC